MSQVKRPGVYFHLHLVSDATGETLNSISKAICAQFENAKAIEHVYALVRSPRQLDQALREIEGAPGIVLYTMMSDDLRKALEDHCQKLSMPCVSVLDPVLSILANYLGTEGTHKAGGQHELDAQYFNRIDALNFTMAHDDGQNAEDLQKADLVLVGVSRTSKTPTCIYLANRGIRAANVPVVKDAPLNVSFESLKRPLVVGLTVSSERLIQIRRHRLIAMQASTDTSYVEEEEVRKEIIFARRLFEKHGWPVIDVSRRSIEETAAAILNFVSRRSQAESGGKIINRERM
jgi:regulator of PEP synthase PpsR (kinase-PPPase family)